MFMQDDHNDDAEVLEMIKKLMEELQGKMQYSSDDFESRLGRKKPDVEISVMKGDMGKTPMLDMDNGMPDMKGMPDGDNDEDDMADDDEDDDMSGMSKMSGGDDLKSRLMRLRRG